MHHLEIALLGSPMIRMDGEPVGTDRHKAIGLLAYLVTEAKPHSREALAALLWPDYPRASAFSYLRRTLWELNQILGKGWVEADRESVSLAHNPGLKVDIDDFQHYLAAGENQAEGLNKAIELYRGEFLEGLTIADTAPFEEWQSERADYFRREHSQALERLAAVYENNADFEHALTYAQRWLALDRLNEPAYRAIMRLMAAMHDRNGAIRTYQACARTLESELGVQPQPETTELYKAILGGEQIERPNAQAKRPAISHLKETPGNMPSPTTPFIGRQEEIEQVSKLARDPTVHLLTLTGLGGTGKTRLSIQVAAEMNGSFPDGVWFIPLATVQTLQGLVMAIAKGIGYSFYAGEEPVRQQLLDYLHEKRLLLILDNFEHLLKAGTELVVNILERAQRVKLMITSRERLNLQSEHVYTVRGMRVPDQGSLAGWNDPVEQAKAYSSIQLLVERARRVRANFAITGENIIAAVRICQLVEGSPLGIELAAAWLEVLPLSEIAREITSSLDFLESTAADTPDRQHSLRAVFETSWKLLKADEQRTFRRLCVFRGSFSRQAAEEVSSGSLRILLKLANKSWLQQGDDGRYQLHEVLKQYGMERLKTDENECREVKNRHAEFYSTYMQKHGKDLQTDNQVKALEALKIELDNNISAAWEWLVSEGRIDDLIDKMLPGLFHYWIIRGGSEDFIDLLRQARKAVPDHKDRKTILQTAILDAVETNFEMSAVLHLDEVKERIEALFMVISDARLEDEMGIWYAVLVSAYGFNLNYQRGSRYFEAISNKSDQIKNPWERGYVKLLASEFQPIEKPEKRKKYLSEALAEFRQIGVIHEQGITLQLLGNQAASQSDYRTAIHLTQTSQQYLEQVNDIWGVDRCWTGLAEYYTYSGNFKKAFQAFEMTRSFNEKSGNRRILGIDLSWESLAHSRYGKLETALELRQKSLEIAKDVGTTNEITWHTWELGEIYRLMGEIEKAKSYYEEALPGFEVLQDHLGLGFYHRGYGDIAFMEGNWSEAKDEYEKALEFHEGERRQLRPWGLVYYHTRLGMALVELGEVDLARQQVKSALEYASGWPYPDIKALALSGAASLLAASGKPAQAIEIASCVTDQPTTWNEVKGHARAIMEEAGRALSPDEVGAAKTKGEGREFNKLFKDFLESI